ncbi:hypothetical protein ACFLY2_02280 [Patescibacteria group bacterium]
MLGVTPDNEKKNDSYENYLSSKDTSILREAKDKFLETNKMYLEYKSFYDDKIDLTNPDKEVILK